MNWLIEYHVSLYQWYVDWLRLSWAFVAEYPIWVFAVAIGSVLWGVMIVIFLALPTAIVVSIPIGFGAFIKDAFGHNET